MPGSIATLPASREELEALIRRCIQEELNVLMRRSQSAIERADEAMAREATAIPEAEGDRPEAWIDWDTAKAELARAEAAGELPD